MPSYARTASSFSAECSSAKSSRVRSMNSGSDNVDAAEAVADADCPDAILAIPRTQRAPASTLHVREQREILGAKKVHAWGIYMVLHCACPGTSTKVWARSMVGVQYIVVLAEIAIARVTSRVEVVNMWKVAQRGLRVASSGIARNPGVHSGTTAFPIRLVLSLSNPPPHCRRQSQRCQGLSRHGCHVPLHASFPRVWCGVV
jgi:hypothetical protein